MKDLVELFKTDDREEVRQYTDYFNHTVMPTLPYKTSVTLKETDFFHDWYLEATVIGNIKNSNTKKAYKSSILKLFMYDGLSRHLVVEYCAPLSFNIQQNNKEEINCLSFSPTYFGKNLASRLYLRDGFIIHYYKFEGGHIEIQSENFKIVPFEKSAKIYAVGSFIHTI